MKRILILYTSVGLGHKFIAQNIGYHLEAAGFEVKLADVLQVQSGPLVDIGEWLHGFINRQLPFVWRWLYMSKLFSKITMPLRVPLAGKNSGHVKQLIDEFQPDMIITTQTSASAPVAYLKRTGLYRGLFVIAFSDYHFHPYWWYKEADFYLLNIHEQKQPLRQLGVPENRMAVCGITLKPAAAVDTEAVKQKLGLSDNKIVLVASGSLGIGFSQKLLVEFARQLKKDQPDTKIVIATGKNYQLKQQLDTIATQEQLNLFAISFYEPFSELLAIADVFLTKPGGLTVAEALRDETKMITTHFLPGQEELNYKYLIARKLMFPIPKPLSAPHLSRIVQIVMAGKAEVENPNSEEITEKNHEGTELIKSIQNLFHTV